MQLYELEGESLLARWKQRSRPPLSFPKMDLSLVGGKGRSQAFGAQQWSEREREISYALELVNLPLRRRRGGFYSPPEKTSRFGQKSNPLVPGPVGPAGGQTAPVPGPVDRARTEGGERPPGAGRSTHRYTGQGTDGHRYQGRSTGPKTEGG